MSERLNLGQFIEVLEKRPSDQGVMFDFGGCVPTGWDSYRGYYDDLALGFSGEYGANGLTLAQLIDNSKRCIGKDFTGWKGGEYAMDAYSRIWVANPGNTSDTIITGVRDCSWWTVIATEWENDR